MSDPSKSVLSIDIDFVAKCLNSSAVNSIEICVIKQPQFMCTMHRFSYSQQPQNLCIQSTSTFVQCALIFVQSIASKSIQSINIDFYALCLNFCVVNNLKIYAINLPRFLCRVLKCFARFDWQVSWNSCCTFSLSFSASSPHSLLKMRKWIICLFLQSFVYLPH